MIVIPVRELAEKKKIVPAFLAGVSLLFSTVKHLLNRKKSNQRLGQQIVCKLRSLFSKRVPGDRFMQ